MREALGYDRVALRYEGAPADAVGPVSVTLRHAERVLLIGPSGAGKSSLLHAATGLFPNAIPGRRRGNIYLDGHSIDTRAPADWADTCGYLFQDAAQTLAGFTVRDEIAFGLENQGVASARIPTLINEAMARAGINPDWAARRITTLSGGERQCVALAALVAQDAPITLADEPSTSLAPQAARRLADVLLARGRTAMIVEHKPGSLLNQIDRCVALGPEGTVLAEGSPDEVFVQQGAVLAEAGIALPLCMRLHLSWPEMVAPGLILRDSVRDLPHDRLKKLRATLLPQPAPVGVACVSLQNADCAPAFGPVVLRDVSVELRAGEVTAILGPNGAGKSTLAACLSGLIPPRTGKRAGPQGAIAFQNPEAHFSRETVRTELAALGHTSETAQQILTRWGLNTVADQHPFTLSQGQKRRLSLALLAETDRWPVLILDEPTAGLDGRNEILLAHHIRSLARQGRAIAVITHDLDFALSVADRALLVDKGRVQADQPCAALLRDTARLTEAGLLPPEAAPLLDLCQPI